MPNVAPSANITPERREQQRFVHLVLGAPRPKPKGANRRKKGKVPAAITLAPGIEERVQLREDWSHKQGTPETHEHVAADLRREGSLARLVASGTLDAHQLAAAQGIGEAFHSITADVGVRTAKWGARGSGGGPLAASATPIAAVMRERAYERWRVAVGVHAPMVLAIVIDDVALTAAARRWRLSNRRARSILVSALDSWRRC